MKKCLAFLLILFFTNVHGFEILPGVKFEKTWFTITFKNITLQHSESRLYTSRDYITLNDVTIFDFDCDNVIDILIIKGRTISRRNNPCEFEYFEKLISEWKQEVRYELTIQLWKKQKHIPK